MAKEQMNATVSKTEKETDKKCPSCGGAMEFNPSNGKMTCPYCGYEEEIQVEHRGFVAQELDFSTAGDDDASCDWGTATKTVICKSCGAETVYDVNEMANVCPYCGSNQVMEQENGKVMAPGGVVTFQISAKEASERFREWIGRKFFCPKLAKDSAKPKAFKGVYAPFWTFDSNTKSTYTAEYGIDHVEEDKDGKKHTTTDWYRTSGKYKRFFDDLLISASSKQNEQMLEGLEPYDTTKAVEYKPEYMAGFAAEKYSVKVKDAWEKAKKKIQSMLRRDVEEKIQHERACDHVRDVRINTVHEDVTYKYLLLPVWISSFQYKDKVYHFMINGQTGKVSGETPISWIKVAIVAAVVIAAAVIIYKAVNADAAVLSQHAALIQQYFKG